VGNRKEGNVPQIIVTADQAQDQDPDGVMLRERVNVEDFESERFAANLVERLGWAVIDATQVERSPEEVERRQTEPVHA
jgi:hypothetical protein